MKEMDQIEKTETDVHTVEYTQQQHIHVCVHMTKMLLLYHSFTVLRLLHTCTTCQCEMY